MRKFALSLTKLEIWVVGLCVVGSFIYQRLLPVAVSSALAFALLRWIAHSQFTIPTPVDWPIGFLMVMLPVTCWVSAAPDITIPQVLRLLAGIGMYYAIVNWSTSELRMRWLLRGLWLAGLLLAMYAFISVQWVTTKLHFIPTAIYSHFQILVSDTANPSVMAGSLVIILPCIMGVLLFCGKRLHWFDQVLSILAMIIAIIVLILTQSRWGIFVFGVILVLLVVLRRKRGWLVLVAGVGLASVVVITFGPMSTIDFISSSASLGGISGRLEIWSRAVYMIEDFLFTGVGMGLYGRTADLLYPFFSYAPGTSTHAHNLFLQIAVDLGVPGLIAWLAIWILMLMMALRLYRHGRARQDSWVCGLGAGFLCSQIALVSHGMLEAVTWGMVKPAPLVWVIWGFTVACWHVYVKREA
jgi:putative inorganic carbon (HCO3(-)) transporter